MPYEDVFTTDGTWIWNKTIAYWVEHYYLNLPQRFLDHLREKHFRIPAKPKNQSEKLMRAFRRLQNEGAFAVVGG